jgi:Signal transduction histidine kinase
LVKVWLSRNTPSKYGSSALNELQPLILLATRLANDMRLYKEAEARRSQALQAVSSASNAKTTFISHMSHEMRTPLTGIIGLLDLIDPHSLTPETAEYIEGAQSSAVSLLSLLNDILDISKIEAGQFTLEKIDFNPFRLAQEIVRPFYPQAEKKGLSLKLDIASEIPDQLVGDPTRIRQVLSNLLNNALKFTAQGKIKVSLKRGKSLPITIDTDDTRFILRGSVKDTGIGIPPEAQEKLFQSFTQAEDSTSRRFGGTGLGLSIVKNLCELMGGKIEVKSQPNKGSNFKFQVVLRYPERFSPSSVLGSVQEKEINLKDVQILLAEDHPTNQKVIKAILLREGCLVTTVNNGYEAVKAVGTVKPILFDLVLMDGMPEMDGVEATTLIRKYFPKEKLPIIAVTADAMKQEEERFFQAGINGIF